MIKAILKGILKMILAILNIVLIPINSLLENLFPTLTVEISKFSSFIQNYIGNGLSYFFNLIPPMTRNLLAVWFAFVVAYYTIYYTYLGITKIWGVIQKIKFW